MAYETMPLTYTNIYVGSRYSESINCVDDVGEPMTFVTDGDWAGRAQFRSDYGGTLVATFTSDGTGDGTVSFDDIGNVTVGLPASFTATLSATNGLQPPVLVGDLELWNTSTPTDRQRVTDFKVRIYPEATTS